MSDQLPQKLGQDGESQDIADQNSDVSDTESVTAHAAETPVSATAETEATQGTLPAPTSSEMKWYIVHTHSGFEAKAKSGLIEQARRKGMSDKMGEILIPVESVVELVKGQKKSTERKFFPGYILVQMIFERRNLAHC